MKKYTCTKCGAIDSERVNLCAPSEEASGIEYTVTSRLAGYEALAWKVIGGHGYPTTWDAFCDEFEQGSSHPDAVTIAHGIFFHTQAIREYIIEGNAEAAALEAMRLEHQAAKIIDASTD